MPFSAERSAGHASKRWSATIIATSARVTHIWNIINASLDRNAVQTQVFFGENPNVLYGLIETRG
jgi:hypothetical protein